jgi:AcrR family transcriptional regulator
VPDRTATRSRERESEATRQTILDATEALLARGGEQAVSIREVCRLARVTAPTVYHHFGDKAALVDRVVDACFAELEHEFRGRRRPADPVAALRWGFDRYVAYGVAHPAHYRLMFSRRPSRSTPAALASYDSLRRGVTAVAAAGRLRVPVEDATAAFWAVLHGVTSLLIASYWKPDHAAIRLVLDGMIAQLTRPAGRRLTAVRGASKRTPHDA